jgi:aspartate 4-decarboxylase
MTIGFGILAGGLLGSLSVRLGGIPLTLQRGLIDLEFWFRKYGGEELVHWIKQNVHPLDPVFRLAEDHGIVLLNGGGFEAPD